MYDAIVLSTSYVYNGKQTHAKENTRCSFNLPKVKNRH